MPNELVRASVSELETTSTRFAESGLFPTIRSMPQAYVIIQTGRELGIPAMAAMTGIAIIKGKPVVGASLIAARVRATGYDYRVRELTNDVCSIEFFAADGDSLGTSTFTIEDARNAGLLGKDNWRQYPRNMLFARAVSNGQKWFCPDAMNGQTVYTPDELGMNVTADGDPDISTLPADDMRVEPADAPPETKRKRKTRDPEPLPEPEQEPAHKPLDREKACAKIDDMVGQIAMCSGVTEDEAVVAYADSHWGVEYSTMYDWPEQDIIAFGKRVAEEFKTIENNI